MSTLVLLPKDFHPADGANSRATLESPHTIASPASLPDSTPPTCHVEDSEDSDTSAVRSTSSNSTAPLSPDHPLTHTPSTLVPLLRRTARIAVCVPPTMSPSLSASIAEVEAISDSTFYKSFRSSYESSTSPSPPDLPSRKLSRDFDSESEVAKDEGPTVEDEGPSAEDEGPVARDEGLVAGDEGPGQGSRSVPEPERPERVSTLRQPTLTTWIDPEDGRTY
ncbi:hypothetical protein Tco_0353260 [Tanacetum coccineum]